VQAMKHLMVKRPLSTQRTDFFPQAETFAAMIKLEYVLIPGTITPPPPPAPPATNPRCKVGVAVSIGARLQLRENSLGVCHSDSPHAL